MMTDNIVETLSGGEELDQRASESWPMKNKQRVLKKLRDYLEISDHITDDELLSTVKHTHILAKVEFSIAVEDLKKALDTAVRDVCAEIVRKAVAEFKTGRTNDKH